MRFPILLAATLALASSTLSLADTPSADEDGTARPDRETTTIAKANGQPIYLEDLERVLSSLHDDQQQQRRGSFDIDRLLDQVIGDVLIAQEAEILGLDEEEPLPTRLREMATDLAVERLKREETVEKVEVSDEELLDTFHQLYRQATFRVVTLETEEAAQELKDSIDDTTDFEALASERSIDTWRNRGGLIEGMDRIDLPVDLAKAVFSSEEDQLLGPVQTAAGWAVIRVESVEEADEARFDQEKRGLWDFLYNGKVRVQEQRFARALRSSFPLEIDQEVLGSIGCTPGPEGRLVATIEDPEAIVARPAGVEISAEELGQALEKRWRGVKNETAALAVKPMVLDTMIDKEFTQAEALRREYDETPEVLRRVGAFERQILVVRYVRETVEPRLEVTDDEIRAYYEEHREKFKKLPRVHLGQITVAERGEADRIAELLEEGADLAWLARQHSIDRFKDSGGTRGWMTPAPGTDPLQDALLGAAAGEVIGPIGAEGNYTVLLVETREEKGLLSLEEMTPRVRSMIFDLKRQEAVEVLIETLRAASEIEIMEDLVASIRISAEQTESAAPRAH